ncbi:MAG: hypothetical protein RIQ84_943 [Pseudomonadota bacterium]|jgi:hypothetical protein
MNASKTLHIDMSEQGMAFSVPATVSQIKGTQELVSAAIAEVGFTEYEKRHLKANKKLKQESHLVSAMYKQVGLLDHMAPHFTSCLVIAVSNSMLYEEPLKLATGESLMMDKEGFFEVLDNLAVSE